MTLHDPDLIRDAIAHGVAGDHQGALTLLQPFVNAGPRSTFTLLAALAGFAAHEAWTAHTPGTWYGVTVVGPDGSESVDSLSAPVRFALQFTAACASRDFDNAYALFWAVAEPADRNGTDDLAEAINAVYDMAVASAEALLDEARRREDDGGSQ